MSDIWPRFGRWLGKNINWNKNSPYKISITISKHYQDKTQGIHIFCKCFALLWFELLKILCLIGARASTERVNTNVGSVGSLQFVLKKTRLKISIIILNLWQNQRKVQIISKGSINSLFVSSKLGKPNLIASSFNCLNQAATRSIFWIFGFSGNSRKTIPWYERTRNSTSSP